MAHIVPELGIEALPFDLVREGPGLPITASFIYRSQVFWRVPHVFKCEGSIFPGDSPMFSLGDRLTIQIVNPLDLGERSPIIQSWIIGIHAEYLDQVEFTMLCTQSDGFLIAFMVTPNCWVNMNPPIPFTFISSNVCYWTYLPSPLIVILAGCLRTTTSPEFVDAWSLLNLLRCKPVGIIVGVDFEGRGTVRDFIFFMKILSHFYLFFSFFF